MAVRRSGVLGSALATAILGLFLYRPAGTLGPASRPETGQYPAAPPSTTQRSEKKTYSRSAHPARTQVDGTVPEGPWIASQTHFAGRAPCSCGLAPVEHNNKTVSKTPCRPASTAGDDLRPWCIPEAERTKIRAMIAVIPDPVQTHLALRFDRAIDAIELAAESMGYVIDRYWLPWELDPKEDWTDYTSFKAARQDRKQKETEPGLLMFRWEARPEDAKATLLYVFLVGETSTDQW
jgi:hypothetical protein